MAKGVKLGVNDLASQYPVIAKEWHPTKNGDLTPMDVSYGSKKNVWWRCPKGHEYTQYVGKRTLRNYRCPLCSRRKTIAGLNDFATVYPEIAQEWHPTKNGTYNPAMFSPKNGHRAWWQCKYGHEWEATIHDRASGTGCPICKNRYSTSYPEQAIYFYVKKLCPDALNRYKDCFDNNMEFDIYIPSRKVAIEFDGAYWHSTEDMHAKEKFKHDYCRENRIKLIRVKEEGNAYWYDTADWTYFLKKRDSQKLQNIIQGIIDSLDTESNDLTRKRADKYHSDLKVDLEKDKSVIMEYLKSIPNSLAELRPDLVDEWNYDKNGNLTPDLFGINSNEKVWWKCTKCGREWQATIISRAGKRNVGCLECSKTKRGKNFSKNKAVENGSLAERNPDILKQWDYQKNDVSPTEITLNSNRKVWWKCDVCGHEWLSSPNSRARGIGCPCCSGRVPSIGKNDLKTVNPNLLLEWDYSKNEKKPEEYLPNSGKKAWWICKKCGNSWEAEIRSRNKGHGCPKCSKKG